MGDIELGAIKVRSRAVAICALVPWILTSFGHVVARSRAYNAQVLQFARRKEFHLTRDSCICVVDKRKRTRDIPGRAWPVASVAILLE